MLGRAIQPDLPVSSGGTVSSYQVTPALPTGITLDPATGVIAGTPSLATPAGTYTVTAVNAIGNASATLMLAVALPATPTLAAINWPVASVGVSVTLTGTNLLATTGVGFNGTPAAAFAVQSATQLTATVPPGVTSGPVSVTTPGGTAIGPVFTPGSVPPPTLTSVAPNPMTDYHAVLVLGTNILSGSRVYVGNVLITDNFSSWPDNSGQWLYLDGLVVPNGKVRIEGSNGQAVSTATLAFSMPPAAATAIMPTSGYPGMALTLTGTGLDKVTAVEFNGASAVPSARSAGQLTVFLPLGASSGPVTVDTASGSTTGPTLTVLAVPPPVLSAIAPVVGQPGNTVILTGQNLLGARVVTFNGLIADTFTVTSSLAISVTVPAGVSSGPVQVTTPAGTATGPIFNLVPNEMLPRINDFNPEVGPVGTTVQITGVNLLGATGVDFAGLGVYTWSVVSDTLITAMTPGAPGADVTGVITVTTPNGPLVSPRPFTVKGYTSVLATVTSIVPNHGVPFGQVQILGTALNRVTAIYFSGGNEMCQASFTVVDSGTLNVVLPGRLSSGAVWLYTPDAWQGSLAAPLAFVADPLVQAAPVIDSFSPMSSTKNWTMVTVKGRNFTNATSVGIGASGPGDFYYVLDDNTVQIHTPMWATTGPVTITTANGTGTSAASFVGPYLPVFYPVSPNNHAKEGDVYHLAMGMTPGMTGFTFGGVPATQWSIADNGHMAVTVPPGALSGFVTVTAPTGIAYTYDNLFIDPTLTSLSPATGTYGTTVAITGRNFQDVTTVTFGGVPALSFRIVSSGLIQAVVPQGAVSGPVGLVNRVGGTGLSQGAFTLDLPATGPVVADFAPAAAAPGDVVALSGSGLAGASSVSLGGQSCAFQAPSDGCLLVTVPPGAVAGPFRVSTPAGSVNAYSSFTPLLESCVNLMINGDFEQGASGWVGSYGSGALIRSALAMPAYDLLPQSGYWTQTVGGWGWQASTENSTRTLDAPTSNAITLPADASHVELRFLVGMKTEENTGVAKDFFNVKLIDPATGALLSGGLLLQLNNLTGTDHLLTPYLLDLTPFKGRTLMVRMESDEDKELATTWTMDDVQVLAYSSASLHPGVAGLFPAAGFPEETVVTLNGTLLVGIQKILFNGVPVVSFKALDAETVETVVPFGASTGPIVIVTGAGALLAPGSFTVTYHPPAVVSLEPTQGPAGTPILIRGQYFKGATQVSLNGLAMTFTVDGDGAIHTVVPRGASTGPIQVAGPGGTCLTAGFTVLSGGSTGDLFIEKVEFIQVTQREDSSVPMVKGRQAMARVYVLANTANTKLPSVTLALYQGTTRVLQTVIPAPAGLTGTPQSATEADFAKTWNVVVPGTLMQPGLKVVAQVNGDGSQAEIDPTNDLWPYCGGPCALDVRDTQLFKVTFVPLAVVKDGVTYTGDVNAGNTDTWLNMFKRIWPLPDTSDVQVHAPFNSQHLPDPGYNDWSPVLSELQALRLAENVHDRYYYGSYHAWWAGLLGGGSGMAFFPPACVCMGIDHEYGWDPSDNLFHWREATCAHELGHTMSRHHTPGCGAADPDYSFPYEDSKVGQWGYDMIGAMAIDPSVRHDIMAYCGFEWVSDYVYRKVMDYRTGGTDPTLSDAAGATAAAGAQDCLLVWGTVAEGQVTLQPSFTIRTVPSVPDPKGSYTVDLVGADGQPLARAAFEPIPADHSPNLGFAVAVPLPAQNGVQKSLAMPLASSVRIQKSGNLLASRAHGVALLQAPGSGGTPTLATRLADGRVRFTWDAAAHPMVMVRNGKGEVIALAQGGLIDLVTDATFLNVQYSGAQTSDQEEIPVR